MFHAHCYMPCHAFICHAMLCHALPCHAMLCCNVSCCSVLCEDRLLPLKALSHLQSIWYDVPCRAWRAFARTPFSPHLMIPYLVTWYCMLSHDTVCCHMIPYVVTWYRMLSHDTVCYLIVWQHVKSCLRMQCITVKDGVVWLLSHQATHCSSMTPFLHYEMLYCAALCAVRCAVLCSAVRCAADIGLLCRCCNVPACGYRKIESSHLLMRLPHSREDGVKVQMSEKYKIFGSESQLEWL
jgi:hypothetical protein